MSAHAHAHAIRQIIEKESAMHPSPAALTAMTDDELKAYRAEIHELDLDADDPFGPYRARKDLIDAIMADRKAAGRRALKYDRAVIDDLRGGNA